MDMSINMMQIISVVTEAVDVINPVLKHHHRRVAVIAYNIGKAYGLEEHRMTQLVVSAALHDIGGLTVRDVEALTEMDVKDPGPHALLGSVMLETFKPFSDISEIIRYHHVDWSNDEINHGDVPVEAYILHLADRLEILIGAHDLALNAKDRVVAKIMSLRGTLFCPEIVDAFLSIAEKEYFWFEIDHLSHGDIMGKIAANTLIECRDEETLEALVYTLSRIIDLKSSFTAAHSKRVAHSAYRLAKAMALPDERCWEIKMAGYMHDIGKIAVPSEIIIKPGKLTKEEFNVMKSHPYYTYQILRHIKGFERVADWAGAHHEKRDQSGYPRKPEAHQFSLEAEIITYADVFAALSEERPYRHYLPLDQVMAIIESDFLPIVGNEAYKVLKEIADDLYDEIQVMRIESMEAHSHIYNS